MEGRPNYTKFNTLSNSDFGGDRRVEEMLFAPSARRVS